MENQNGIIKKRVLPYIVSLKEMEGDKQVTRIYELTPKEIKNMSCEAMMLERIQGSDLYRLIDTPIIGNYETGIRHLFCYDFDELTLEEQEKYFSRSVLIPVVATNEEVNVQDKDATLDEGDFLRKGKKPKIRLFSRRRTRK